MGKYSFGKNGPTFDGQSMVPELGTVITAFKTISTTAVPAIGSCAVQFVFSDASGSVVVLPVAGLAYLSKSATGLTHDLADTSLAVLTNGALTNIGGVGPSLFTSTAAGLLGMTITALAGSYYIVFIMPDGSMTVSGICTIN